MSVIVYRSGIMAADSRAFTGRGNPPIGSKWKIRRMKDGTLVGVSTSEPGIGEFLLNWYQAGHDCDEAVPSEDYTILAVKPDGTAYLGVDSLHLTGPIEAEYFAIGSGAEYALGAMKMGASASEAVGVAIEFDCHSGGPIKEITHRPAK